MKRRRGMRADRLDFVAQMREMGCVWPEIAVAVRERFGGNGFVAMRLAHSWSQTDAAKRWNQRWPDDPKTHKNFSYWENWRLASGYAPSLKVLEKLARLFECAVSDLVVDLADHRDEDLNSDNAREVTPAGRQVALSTAIDPVLTGLADAPLDEVAGAGLLWANKLDPGESGHGLLMKLSTGLALAASRLPRPDHQASAAVPIPAAAASASGTGLVGVWLSRHSRGGHPGTELLVVLTAHRGRLLVRSLPHLGGSLLRMELDRAGGQVSGVWEQQNADGRLWYGAIRLTLDPDARRMTGQWLGYGVGYHAAGGDWELTWHEESVTGSVLLAHRAPPARTLTGWGGPLSTYPRLGY